jgi:hypothetical protein
MEKKPLFMIIRVFSQESDLAHKFLVVNIQDKRIHTVWPDIIPAQITCDDLNAHSTIRRMK